MRTGWAIAAALAALLLGGCYGSEKLLLDPALAVTPLALGVQRTEGDDPQDVRVRLGRDNWYTVRVDGKDDRMLFTTLAGAPGRFAFAFREDKGYVYGVAENRGGRVYFDLPACGNEAARKVAVDNGAASPVQVSMAQVCTFTDAVGLRAALAAFAKLPGKTGLTSLPAK